MNKFFNQLFKLIFVSKFRFFLPKKNKVVIYDAHSIAFAKLIFKKFELIHTRLEEINISVLLISIFKYGFNNLSFNYRKTYLDFINPKIVFTSIDTNFGFYSLKEKLNKYTFISVQNGMRLKKHYKEFQLNKKKIGQKIITDYIFTLGEIDKIQLKKVFNARIEVIGNIFSNSINIKRKKKKETIVYIQQASLPLKKNPKNFAEAHQKDILDQEIHLINFTYNYCKKNKYKFIIFIKRQNTKNLLKKVTNLNDLNFKSFSFNKEIGYKILDNSKLVITPFSTLGFESVARGNKTVILPPKRALNLNDSWFPSISENYSKSKLKKYFLFGKLSEKQFNNHIKRIISMPTATWKKTALKISKNVLFYDAKNKKLREIINKVLIRNK